MVEAKYALETTNLTKTYGGKNAVDNVDLKIQKGDIYGFIGKNGAGKTTAIRMIIGLARPTKGEIKLFESSSSSLRMKTGAVIENPALYPYMTAQANLHTQRILMGVKDKKVVNEILEVVGLSDTGRKKVKNFSLGMKQRLAIGLALLNDPEFLFLDEPINGLDPTGIKELRDLILMLNKERNITILISSHIIGELTKIATRYGVLHKGKLVDQFTKEDLDARTKRSINLRVNNIEETINILVNEIGVQDYDVDEETGIVVIYDNLDKFAEINKALAQSDVIVNEIWRDDGDNEDYFIKLMEGEKNDECN